MAPNEIKRLHNHSQRFWSRSRALAAFLRRVLLIINVGSIWQRTQPRRPPGATSHEITSNLVPSLCRANDAGLKAAPVPPLSSSAWAGVVEAKTHYLADMDVINKMWPLDCRLSCHSIVRALGGGEKKGRPCDTSDIVPTPISNSIGLCWRAVCKVRADGNFFEMTDRVHRVEVPVPHAWAPCISSGPLGTCRGKDMMPARHLYGMISSRTTDASRSTVCRRKPVKEGIQILG
ncbi:hypothetical protein BC827DRAFT_780331 [Russula dissimulans]|nr:hypothetical protein BC827DRAFT_780331 [Russula dissimulans]